MKRSVVLFLLLLSAFCVWAQSTRVRGKITDAKTGEPLPLVNVVFKGSFVGVTTDFDGMYFIETREAVEELQASL